ncbi:protein of unknown function [Limnospira indica PCC 8005]|uniref:Uncharacterized protein n=1 Tax=Limnospira indica PCC 8005 TaxID=376219 RepID=A0A9P1P0U3_9CYAN|nr:protein of unknown function [Limnospira indica PCC 8005]
MDEAHKQIAHYLTHNYSPNFFAPPSRLPIWVAKVKRSNQV